MCFWPALLKLVNYEPVSVQVMAMKFRFCGDCILHFFPLFEHQFWLFVIVKIKTNKLRSVFYASVLLLMINFVITLSKLVVDPFAAYLCLFNDFWWEINFGKCVQRTSYIITCDSVKGIQHCCSNLRFPLVRVQNGRFLLRKQR